MRRARGEALDGVQGDPPRRLLSTDRIVAAVVVVVFAAVVVRMFAARRDSVRFAVRAAQAVAADQGILDEIQRELIAAREIYRNDVTGLAVLQKIELPQAAPPIPNTKLPRLLGGAGDFRRELSPGARTGNALLFAVDVGPKRVRCGPVEAVREYELDVCRVLCYYLTAVGEGPRPGVFGGLDLCRFVSVPLVDAAHVATITDDEDRATVLRALAGAEVTGAWRAVEGGAPEWFKLDADSAALVPVERLAADPQRTSWELLGDGLEVASNHAPESFGVGQLGVVTEAGGGFPHGFELQLAGGGLVRQLMVHLTVVGAGPGAPVSADLRNVVVVRSR